MILINFAEKSYMKLQNAILQIINIKGQQSVLNQGIVEDLKCKNAFDEEPSAEFILRTFIADGYANRMLSIGKWNEECREVIKNFIVSTGFRSRICNIVIRSIAYGIGWIDLYEALNIKRLYHYTTLEKFKLIWSNKSLKYGSFEKANDLFESERKWQILRSRNNQNSNQESNEDTSYIKQINQAFKSKIANYGQICFTCDNVISEGYMSPMMWGQYAENGKGVCIELDGEKLALDSDCLCDHVTYVYDYPALKFYKEDVDSKGFDANLYIEEHPKRILFTKRIDWEHENEFRIVRNTENGGQFLSIKNAIKKVYCCPSKSSTIEQDLNNIINKEVYIANIIIMPQRINDDSYSITSWYNPSINKPALKI